MTLFVDGRPVTDKAFDAFDVDGFEPGVDNVPDLRAVIDHNDKDLIFVKSLQDIFYYDATSTAVDDGATVIQPTDVTGPGRWLIVPGSGIPGAHAATHQSGAGDEMDGDLLDIDIALTNITPDTSPPEVTTVAQLGAILKGIDNALGTVGGSIASQEVRAANLVSRASALYGDIPNMSITPGVGTYLAFFSAEVHRLGTTIDSFFRFAVNGVAVPNTILVERLVASYKIISNIARVTVAAAPDALTVQWRGDSATQAAELRTRSLNIIKL